MRSTLLACLVLCSVLPARAADAASAGAPVSPVVIRELLEDFLAHNSDPDRHENFWADDLVYISAQGVVRTKAEIMAKVHEEVAKGHFSRTDTRPSPFSAEDVDIRPYNGFATLTFRLVVHSPNGTVDYYRNSGTLIFRDGRWQIVTWQATRAPSAGKK